MISYSTIFSENLKKFLAQQKLTQAELAAKADISKTTVNLILRGKYNPSLELMSKISDILSVPLFLFFVESDSQSGKCHRKELENGKVVITAIVSKTRAFQIEKWHNSVSK